jgi:DNA-binding transcriptional regulator YdaS (Cro superfamily)
MSKQTPIARAIEVAGTKAALATAVGVTPGLIYQWLSGLRPLAAHHCPAIERATGVTCEDLRPDLNWLRDESGAVTGYQVPTRAA